MCGVAVGYGPPESSESGCSATGLGSARWGLWELAEVGAGEGTDHPQSSRHLSYLDLEFVGSLVSSFPFLQLEEDLFGILEFRARLERIASLMPLPCKQS